MDVQVVESEGPSLLVAPGHDRRRVHWVRGGKAVHRRVPVPPSPRKRSRGDLADNGRPTIESPGRLHP